jgi:GTP-binding protein LepA
MKPQESIRNFSIIAHIDHGKSTLADRLLEATGTLRLREMRDQVLDSMDLERERGITIKAHAVRMDYKSDSGAVYELNLIDTPGHVDFTYEVSRSLAACEGALLVVDASQGVEAQTIANAQLAKDHHLILIPVINKIDLPGADVDRTQRQLREVLGFEPTEAVLISAKEGIGIHEVLETVVNRIPPPAGNTEPPLRALIFDSWFDNYQGAIVLVRVMDGSVKTGSRILLLSNRKTFQVIEVGSLVPPEGAGRSRLRPAESLTAGQVGYLIAGIRQVSDTKIGDTVTETDRPATQPLPGYREVKPMVFCGLYVTDTSAFEELRTALEKLRLNDSAFSYEPETSLALGFGFRCGFLGLLHMEIIQERLEREFGLSLITTSPTVVYRVTSTSGEVLSIDNPAKLPPPQNIAQMEEPYILVTLVTPQEYVGNLLRLCEDRRGIQRELTYLDAGRVVIRYELPLNEVILDFYDKLKTMSKGYASMDYELLGYRLSELVRVDILLNGETVDALSFITHREKSYARARLIAAQMKELIPRQMFEVAIQAAIGNRIIARETVSAMRKNVTAKCYGGDITRKRKLWEKQKEGKKRMKQVGRVEIPQEAFLALLKIQG